MQLIKERRDKESESAKICKIANEAMQLKKEMYLALNNTRKPYRNDEENTFKLILNGSIFLQISIKLSFSSID